MTSSLFDVSGRVALVTGSSRGIGLALAQGLAEVGAVVVLNSRNGQELALVAQSLRDRTGADVHAVPFDVTDPAAVAAGVALVEDTIGPLAICVNNAGVQRRTPFVDFSLSDWDTLIATNLTSVFLVSQQAARRMQARGRGKIIHIASVNAEAARRGITPYAATKGAIKMLTRGMSAELAASGVCVNALGPGYFSTDMNAALVGDEAFSNWVSSRVPVGRWGKVEELVGTLLYLASDASDFVHGQVIYVDGGMLAVL